MISWKFWVLIGLGIASILYFLIRTIIKKPERLYYSIVWVILGVSMLILSALDILSTSIIIDVLIYFSFLCWMLLFVGITIVFCAPAFENKKANNFEPKYIILLGLKKDNAMAEREMLCRVRRAYMYWMEHPDSKIICSGGNADDKHDSEASYLKQFLLDFGVPADSIIEENRSGNTMGNLMFSMEIIGDLSYNIAIVTSSYHLFRAVFFARRVGYLHVLGVASKFKSISWLNCAGKEVLVFLYNLFRLSHIKRNITKNELSKILEKNYKWS